MTTLNRSSPESLAVSVGFDLLGERFGDDVAKAVSSALKASALFPGGGDALAIFRHTLAASIRDIEEEDDGGPLFQRFLRDGPYEREGPIPPELRGKRLTAEECAEAITFVYSFMVNSFKGAVTELLAAGACQRLMRDPRVAGRLPAGARLYVGDSVLVRRASGRGGLKGADLHILAKTNQCVTVVGVVEVKSGRKSAQALTGQLDKHIRRARFGLIVGSDEYPAGEVRLGAGDDGKIMRITVLPSEWPLPRTLRFEERGEMKRELVLDPPVPPRSEDEFIPKGNGDWHIVLRWSREAIAAAAYEMTFWYMEKVGEAIYTQKAGEPDPKPKDWAEMTPAEAGRNAIKMMLYYAIRPDAILAEKAKEQNKPLPRPIARRLSRAIALYNTYGFGYALGMNYRNSQGRREMLWPQDLDEIALNGQTANGCRIAGTGRR
ncbi:MAG: hypothetical protein FJ222_02470 [Lentisphaerae bacterium]|nr:hypothetical protein [Lentisphaerota bacterium]